MFKQISIMLLFVAASMALSDEYSLRGHANEGSPMDMDTDTESDRELFRFNPMATYQVTVTNIAYAQPMSPFFLMVHGSSVPPVFALGEAASPALATLAENGNATALQTMYEGMDGVMEVQIGSGPIPPGGSATYTITISHAARFLSLASMAVNTNDCFVGATNFFVRSGTFFGPGYDAGSEENNESCASIPGPACAMMPGNVASGSGEGFVHVHRGVHGISDLQEEMTDWRNPMVRVTLKRTG